MMIGQKFSQDKLPIHTVVFEQFPNAIKEVYYQFLTIRLAHADIFLKQAQDARTTLI